MTDPRVAAAREWIAARHAPRDHYGYECRACDQPWSEHPAMLLAALDAADPDKATP